MQKLKGIFNTEVSVGTIGYMLILLTIIAQFVTMEKYDDELALAIRSLEHTIISLVGVVFVVVEKFQIKLNIETDEKSNP